MIDSSRTFNPIKIQSSQEGVPLSAQKTRSKAESKEPLSSPLSYCARFPKRYFRSLYHALSAMYKQGSNSSLCIRATQYWTRKRPKNYVKRQEKQDVVWIINTGIKSSDSF